MYLDVRKHANPNTSIMVLGNKSDLDSKRQVTREEAERWAKENDLFYLETSAKAANNVEEAFVKTTEDIYNKIKAGVFDVSNQVRSVVMITLSAKVTNICSPPVEWRQARTTPRWFVAAC